MGLSKAKTYSQPNDFTCVPSSLKTALEILGQRRSLNYLTRLCKTTRNGTSLKNLVKAANKLGLSVMAIEKASLRHVKSTLNHPSNQPRAIIVNYLYKDHQPEEETGHCSTVAGFSHNHRRIILFDPYAGQKKSFTWTDFLDRWYDYEVIHRRKIWQIRLMIIFARQPDHLPKFKITTAKVFLPAHNHTYPRS
jgi:ABC-type bacteriocin/lantibiotic exporter with double-glycine peptidase domain